MVGHLSCGTCLPRSSAALAGVEPITLTASYRRLAAIAEKLPKGTFASLQNHESGAANLGRALDLVWEWYGSGLLALAILTRAPCAAVATAQLAKPAVGSGLRSNRSHS